VFPADERPAVPLELSPPENASSLKVTMWRHWKGKSERLSEAAPKGRIPDDFHDPRLPYSASLGGGVRCLVPLALFVDDQGTVPRGSPPLPNPTFPSWIRATEIVSLEKGAHLVADASD